MVDSIHRAPPAQPAVPVTLGRTLRPAGDGMLSALPPCDEGAPYDRRAAAYDRLVASPLYNRLLWRTSPRTYAAFAAEALRAGDGPLLDVACAAGSSQSQAAGSLRPMTTGALGTVEARQLAVNGASVANAATLTAEQVEVLRPRGEGLMPGKSSSEVTCWCRPASRGQPEGAPRESHACGG